LKTVCVQFGVDEARVDAAQVIGSETVTGERSLAEALHKDVALAHQSQRNLAVGTVPEIQVGILFTESSFDVEADDVIQIRIAAVDHIGAVFREQFADRESGDDVGKVQYA